LTWANGLTALRFLLIVPLVALIVSGQWQGAAAVFSVAILSDVLDGHLARRAGADSSLGSLLDHATDATLVAAALAALWFVGLIPALLPPLLAAAFLQYALDSRVHRGQPLRASWLGRLNGIGYFIAAGAPIYRNALTLDWPPDALIHAFGWLLVATTVASMVDRLVAWRAAD
jgi:phosphatidylglycerophosphate synthase